jgi:hypothetical protein
VRFLTCNVAKWKKGYKKRTWNAIFHDIYEIPGVWASTFRIPGQKGFPGVVTFVHSGFPRNVRRQTGMTGKNPD